MLNDDVVIIKNIKHIPKNQRKQFILVCSLLDILCKMGIFTESPEIIKQRYADMIINKRIAD